MYDPYDFYFKKAKKEWFKARSAFKLEEIDQKFKLFSKDTKKILDIWCAPWSWMQYAVSRCQKNNVKNYQVIWLDLKEVELNIPWVQHYVQDVTDIDAVKKIFEENHISKLDLIQSDMAPNTIWFKDIDAMRSIVLLESTLRVYKTMLSPTGKFVIKIFMWPWFDEFILDLKKHFWWKNIKTFKPKSCRKESKETYIIKI